MSDFGVCAQRSRRQRFSGRCSCGCRRSVPGRDNRLGGVILFAPLRDRSHRIEAIGPGTAGAMHHARCHKEPSKSPRRLNAHFPLHALIILDGAPGGDRGVGPALKENELSATRGEGAEIRIIRVDNRAELSVCASDVLAEIEVVKIPLRIAPYKASEEVVCELALRPDTEDPKVPIVSQRLVAWWETGINALSSFGFNRTVEVFANPPGLGV